MTVFVSAFKIGLSSGSSLSSFATPIDDPKSTYHPYSQELQLGDGLVRGAGWATATWTWKILNQAQRDELRTLIPGKSVAVYLTTRTLDNASSYANFTGVAIWPTDEEYLDATRRPDFVLHFQKLVAA